MLLSPAGWAVAGVIAGEGPAVGATGGVAESVD
jgi:hypothetical protein